jgi:hypothetical protein
MYPGLGIALEPRTVIESLVRLAQGSCEHNLYNKVGIRHSGL